MSYTFPSSLFSDVVGRAVLIMRVDTLMILVHQLSFVNNHVYVWDGLVYFALPTGFVNYSLYFPEECCYKEI